jgi:hypothetical protein
MAKYDHPEGLTNHFPKPGVAVLRGVVDINGRADGVEFDLAAPVGTDRAVSLQLLTAVGEPVARRELVRLHVFADADGADWAATGGSTGIVEGAEGQVLALVAKKVFLARSNATGAVELTWTDTASEVAFLGVELPSGRLVVSGALTI